MRSRRGFPGEVLAVLVGALIGWATTTQNADTVDRPPVEATRMDARPYDQQFSRIVHEHRV